MFDKCVREKLILKSMIQMKEGEKKSSAFLLGLVSFTVAPLEACS